jgi:hypothetical protein
MSEATIRLLQAAAEILGGERYLAERLQIDEPLLAAFMQGRLEIQDPLLLKAVDILLSATAGPPGSGARQRAPS